MLDEMRLILDTPSKKTLWAYILPRMPLDHRDYVFRMVDLPKQQILGEETRDNTLEDPKCVVLLHFRNTFLGG